MEENENVPENRGGNGMSQRKSAQIEKFNARLAKARKDEEAVYEDKLSSSLDDTLEMLNEDKLKKQGNIEEAAAVVSYEGLQMFANIFTNSMEASVEKAMSTKMQEIESMFEAKLEEKFSEALRGVSTGMKQFTEDMARKKIEEELKHSAKDEIYSLDKNSDVGNLVVMPIPNKPKPFTVTKQELETPVIKPKKETKPEKDEISVEKDIVIPDHGKVLLEEIDEKTRKELVAKFAPEHNSSDEQSVEMVTYDEDNEVESVKDYEGELEATHRTSDYSIDLPTEEEEVKSEVSISTEKYQGEPVKLSSKQEDLELVAPVVNLLLKKAKKPVSVSDIRKHILDYEGYILDNPSLLMRYVVRTNNHIEKAGYGLYEYEEKTFNRIN